MWVRGRSVSAQDEDGPSNSQSDELFWNREFLVTEEIQVGDWEDWSAEWVLWLDDAQKHFHPRLKSCDAHRVIVHYRPHVEDTGTQASSYRTLVVVTEVKIMSDNCKMI